MKAFILALAAASVLVAPMAIACPDQAACKGKIASAQTAPAAAKADTCTPEQEAQCKRTVNLHVTGMKCNDCVGKVTKGLRAVKGVEGVQVSLKDNAAEVQYCSMELKDTKALLKAVKKAGFSAKFASAPKAVTVKPASTAAK